MSQANMRVLSRLYYSLQKKHYYWRKKKQQRFSQKKIISIGNVTVGGSGKTPLTLYLAKKIIAKNIPLLIVLRGYRGKSSRSSGSLVNHNSKTSSVGDEAIEIYHELYKVNKNAQVKVAIGKNRANVIKMFANNAKIVILDDAMQNPSIFHDLEITIVDLHLNYEHEQLLPHGRLREPISAISRSDLLLMNVSGMTDYDAKTSAQKILQYCSSSSQVYFMRKHLHYFYHPHSQTKYKNLKIKDCLVICAIARPQHFFQSLQSAGYKINSSLIFRDHHQFHLSDFKKIFHQFAKDIPIIVTNKDWVKIKELSGKQSRTDQEFWRLFYPRIYVCFEQVMIDRQNHFLSKIWQNISSQE